MQTTNPAQPETAALLRSCKPLSSVEEAAAAAEQIANGMALEGSCRPVEIIGRFVVPPEHSAEPRDFQTLHFDFGLPLTPGDPADIARYTALYMPVGLAPSAAVTRFVVLDALLDQRRWAPPDVLLDRFASYGASHGAWDHTAGYLEGSLARLIEAAIGDVPRLPSVSAEPNFLCGLEFDELQAESAFFAERGLDISQAQIEIALQPGELLVFDNLRLAHGRRGVRQPAELRQIVLGHRALDREGQTEIRDVVLRAFQPA